MPNSYLTGSIDSPKETSQRKPIPGENQVQNAAGGYVYQVDKWSTLRRFLILGTEGGTYYASEQKLTEQNSINLLACINEDGLRTVRVICEVSTEGAAPKNDSAIYALALASVKGDEATRKTALDALPLVCRTGTHLFTFAELRDKLGGWGRGVKRAVGNWYTEKDADDLALQLIKYRQRGGWSHRDLLRLSHPKGEGEIDGILHWATKVATHGQMSDETVNKFLKGHSVPRIEGFEKIQDPAINEYTVISLIQEYRLPRETIPTEFLNKPAVQEALIHSGSKGGQPIGALVRNLAAYTRSGLLTPTSSTTQHVVKRLLDAEQVSKSRIHPMQVLFALKTYAAGRSVHGSGVWAPVSQITDALDEAFYLAFGNVEATGKRKMIALDISGSMWGGYGGWVGGIPNFSAAQAAGAMAMVSIKTGDPFEVVAFADANSSYGIGGYRHRRGDSLEGSQLMPGLHSMSLSARQRLDDVDHAMRRMSNYMGGTDAALPMLYASDAGREIDVFEVYTDNETWAGAIHPSQALRKYRQKSGINAKLISVGMTATDYSIADPSDAGMMDVVGFDTAAPGLMAAFAKGQL